MEVAKMRAEFGPGRNEDHGAGWVSRTRPSEGSWGLQGRDLLGCVRDVRVPEWEGKTQETGLGSQ